MYYTRKEILALAINLLLNGFVYALPGDINNYANAPIIQLDNGSIGSMDNKVELPFGVAWNVSCKSNVPIVWEPYEPLFDWTPPSVTSTAIATSAEMQYEAVLTITNASAASVGQYYCVSSEKKDEDLEEMKKENYASSVYVFVKDDKQPLVPIPGAVYYAQREEAFLPCKPSYQGIDAELCNKAGECLSPSTDATKGFRFSKITFEIPEDGTLICRYDNVTHTIRTIPIKQLDLNSTKFAEKQSFPNFKCLVSVTLTVTVMFIIFIIIKNKKTAEIILNDELLPQRNV